MEPPEIPPDQPRLDRRRVLVRLGKFAAYTAPVVTTLLISRAAGAHHRPGHVIGPINACDNPNPPPFCDDPPAPPPCAGANPPPVCGPIDDVGSLSGGSGPQQFAAPPEDTDWNGNPDPGSDEGWN